jgi:integrase
MPKKRLAYTETFLTRHGKRMWYFRVGKGQRVPLPGAYGAPEFTEAYRAALAKHTSGEMKTGRTLAWLVDQYRHSPAYEALARETKKQFRYQLDALRKNSGDSPIAGITGSTISASRDKRAVKPSDANKFLKCDSSLFRFAVDRQWMLTNPAKGIGKIKTASIGFQTWTEDEAQAFEARWPIGTRERLAFDMLVYTGVRRSDVVRLGRQHTRQGEITITTEKSRNMGKPVEVTITILPPLARSIEATATGDMTYLVTLKRTAFTKEAFGNWFRAACRVAECSGSSHGLRKLAAVRMAENGATEAELNAVFGWSSGSGESATYIAKASRKKLARTGIVKTLPQTNSQTPTPNLRNKG